MIFSQIKILLVLLLGIFATKVAKGVSLKNLLVLDSSVCRFKDNELQKKLFISDYNDLL